MSDFSTLNAEPSSPPSNEPNSKCTVEKNIATARGQTSDHHSRPKRTSRRDMSFGLRDGKLTARTCNTARGPPTLTTFRTPRPKETIPTASSLFDAPLTSSNRKGLTKVNLATSTIEERSDSDDESPPELVKQSSLLYMPSCLSTQKSATEENSLPLGHCLSHITSNANLDNSEYSKQRSLLLDPSRSDRIGGPLEDRDEKNARKTTHINRDPMHHDQTNDFLCSKLDDEVEKVFRITRQTNSFGIPLSAEDVSRTQQIIAEMYNDFGTYLHQRSLKHEIFSNK